MPLLGSVGICGTEIQWLIGVRVHVSVSLYLLSFSLSPPGPFASFLWKFKVQCSCSQWAIYHVYIMCILPYYTCRHMYCCCIILSLTVWSQMWQLFLAIIVVSSCPIKLLKAECTQPSYTNIHTGTCTHGACFAWLFLNYLLFTCEFFYAMYKCICSLYCIWIAH